MASYVVWLDHEHGRVFKFLPGKTENKQFKHSLASHPTAHAKDRHHSSEKLFSEITHFIHDAQEILIVGPGTARNDFKHFLEKHNHLDKKIVGIEPMDQATDNQIVAHARKFFKAHDLFN